MQTRTIVINSDRDWSFRELLWCHALDLYPADTGVSFYDTVERGAAEAGRDTRSYRNVIGNFPEDFSTEGETLREEFEEIVATLAMARNRDTFLSVALVIGRDDLVAIGAAGDNASPPVSPHARRGIDAMLAAMRAIEALSDADETRVVSRMSRRAWFSLVVRDAGANSRDMRHGERALYRLRHNRIGIQSLFFLSEGNGQDKLGSARDRQFTKLRLLIDVFMQGHTEAVQKQFREPSRRSLDVDGDKMMWVRRGAAPDDLLSESDLLRRELIRRFGATVNTEDRSYSDDWKAAFEQIRAEIVALVPGLGDARRAGEPLGDGYSIDTARSAVITAQRAPGDEISGETADADPETEIEALVAVGGRGRADWLHSASRIAAIRRNAAEFESALATARGRFQAAVRQQIHSLRDDHEQRRMTLEAVLDRYRVPSTQDGRHMVDGFCAAPDDAHAPPDAPRATAAPGDVPPVDRVAAQAEAQIEAARRIVERDMILSHRADQACRQARDAALARLIDAETRLLRAGSAAAVILMVTLVALLPILTVHVMRYLSFSTGASDWLDLLGPAGLVLLFSVLISTLFAFSTAFRLARIRNRARDDRAALMRAHYEALKTSWASLVQLAVNRWRLSLLGTVRGALHPRPGAVSHDQSGSFIETLKSLQNAFPQPVDALDEAGKLAIEAAFGLPGTLSDKVAQALVADRGGRSEALLRLQVARTGDTEITLRTSASVHDQSLRLGWPGDD